MKASFFYCPGTISVFLHNIIMGLLRAARLQALAQAPKPYLYIILRIYRRYYGLEVFVIFTLLLQGFFMFLQVSGGGSFPKTLSPEEEKHYLDQLINGEPQEKKQAKEELISRNLRLVAHIVKKYNAKDSEDLISIGTIGLIKGITTFNPGRGTKLATYASRCIENAIHTKEKIKNPRLNKRGFCLLLKNH